MSLPRFGVVRPVPVNSLMAAFLLSGIACGLTMTREFFPETTPMQATVTLPYPGATPEEIEESLARKVEDKLADLDEVEQLTTTIAEGGGVILVEFRDGIDDVRYLQALDRAVRAARQRAIRARAVCLPTRARVWPSWGLTARPVMATRMG